MFFRSKFLLSVCTVMAACTSPAFSAEPTQESVAPLFKNYKNGCFELLDCQSGKIFRYNADLCSKRLPPLSTFKIFNALAGLDCGVLKDANHPMKWDGKKYPMESWNKDQTLASAMRDSVVWYFQKVAEGIGEERMKKYIQDAHFGNEDISGGITQFWLGTPLSISADEQVDFLRSLYFGSLPFSKRSMDIVKEITALKTTAAGELHGKTGTEGRAGKMVMGWFVGYVVHGGQAYAFATIVQNDDRAWGRKARELTEKILEQSGLL